ncbi:hypothetical protein Dda_4109 [Drechslerella dactyloides]|uniref:Glycosyltransferase family 31 protein n=1 Tax=Drechslerella dactyloides TaxID=74499 RepID=A0AAD6J0N0_DREDA|nr:hypothetical protein Dda_4109 [Drechslerella dactyloides]
MLTNGTGSIARRSPLLLICILIVLVTQCYFFFKYNAEVAARLRPFVEQATVQPVRTMEAERTITITSVAVVPSVTPAVRRPSTPSAPLHDVVLSIKTGATVIFNRVPTQLLTFVQQFPETLIYSDLKTKLGDWDVSDTLSHISADVAGDTLKHWRSMQEVAILIRSYQKNPHASYYLFIDGDTSLIPSNWWPYLLAVSMEHNPLTSPIYHGASASLGSFAFGHGGSGYLINQAAMRKLIPEGRVHDEAFLSDLERNYTKLASHSCCGDYVLAHAMADRGLPIMHQGPFYQGDPWWNLPWKEGDFCKPVGTMHHHFPEDMQDMWEFEQAMLRKNGRWRPNGWTPQHEQGTVKWKFSNMPTGAKDTNLTEYKHILYRDMYDWFVAERLPREVTREEGEDWGDSAVRIGWDNRSWTEGEFNENKLKEAGTSSEQWKKDAITSEKNCRLACEQHIDGCVQWFYREGHCGYSSNLKYGRRLPQDGTIREVRQRGISGWIPRRVEEKEKKLRAKCPG